MAFKKRIRDLRSKPEWRVLVEAAVGDIMGAIGPVEQAAAQFRLEQLIEKSNASFGDWRKVPKEILYFGGKK